MGGRRRQSGELEVFFDARWSAHGASDGDPHGLPRNSGSTRAVARRLDLEPAVSRVRNLDPNG